jgi:hypothetical protein
VPRSKAEESFIDQYTRSLTVEWADHMARYPDGIPLWERVAPVYFDHALAKGWITKREPHRLTAKGFQVAASFLKR